MSKSSSTVISVHSSKCEVRTLQGQVESTMKEKRQNRMLTIYTESFTVFYYLMLLIINFPPRACSPSPTQLSFSISEIANGDTQF